MERHILFADIETSNFKDNLDKVDIDSYLLEFKLGCFIEFDYTNDKVIEKYYSVDNIEFNEKLISQCHRNRKKVVYFHNLRFDSKFFIDFLYDHFYEIKVIRTDSKIISIRCYKKRKDGNQIDCVLEFRDSLSILLVSIERLGKMLNLPKLEFNFDYQDIKRAISYCFRDCEIIYFSLKQLYIAIMKEFALINKRTKKPLQFTELPLTIASLAKKVMMSYYPNVFYKVDKHLESRMRKYYFGGRTEVFDFSNAQNSSYLDENSEYPFLLSSREFSNGTTYRYKAHKVDWKRNKNIIAYELLIKENLLYPIYPIKVNGIIYYPKGVKRVLMNKFEYDYLKKHGYFKRRDIEILDVYYEFRVVEFITFKKLFLRLYELRTSYSKTHIFHYIFKILMNSGYGKFGEKPQKEIYEYVGKERELTRQDLANGHYYELDNVIFQKKLLYQDFLKINLFNAILTTSYARFDIWIMLEKCRLKGIKGFYTDTDSIVIENQHLKKLSRNLSDEFGKWKVEQSFTFFQAIDSKEYIKKVDDKIYTKFKTVPNEYIDSLEKIKNHILYGTKVNMIGSFYYCQNRHSDNKTVHIVKKHKKSFYNKRIIQDDLSTLPIDSYDLTDEYLREVELNNKQIILNQIIQLET